MIRHTDYHHGEVCTMLGNDFVPLERDARCSVSNVLSESKDEPG